MTVESSPSANSPEFGLLSIDAGQSALNWRSCAGPSAVTGSRPGVVTSQPILPQLAGAIAAIKSEASLPVTAVTIGAAGSHRPNATELLHLLRPSGIRAVTIAHDSVTNYLGAVGDKPGVMIAAGTGVICLAVGDGQVARVDGWGPLMGDAGSAYWIGRNALEAAMRGYDGRRQMTALTEAVAADFVDLEEAYLELLADPNRVARIAAYAEVVDELAPVDPVAANILHKAAAHLSEAVLCGARRAGLMTSTPPLVVAIGRAFASDRLLRKLTEYLTLQWPNFALHEAEGNGLTGAAMLPRLHDGPLASRIHRASR